MGRRKPRGREWCPALAYEHKRRWRAFTDRTRLMLRSVRAAIEIFFFKDNTVNFLAVLSGMAPHEGNRLVTPLPVTANPL